MRPQPRVHLAVPTKAAGVFEGFSALLTHVGPLACVLPQVVLVVRAPLEGQRAMWALERPYTCMHPLVDGEERGSLEGLPTLGAAVRSFPSVVPHVVLQA